MRTLLDEAFAPITSPIGFLELPLAEAEAALDEWRTSLYRDVQRRRVDVGLPEALRALDPQHVAGWRGW